MAEKVRARDFGRDGVSGMVDHDRALRSKLVPRPTRAQREAARQRIAFKPSTAANVERQGPTADPAAPLVPDGETQPRFS